MLVAQNAIRRRRGRIRNGGYTERFAARDDLVFHLEQMPGRRLFGPLINSILHPPPFGLSRRDE